MITSIRNWRQQLFTSLRRRFNLKGMAVIGMAHNGSQICLVQIQYRYGRWALGPWRQIRLSSFSVENSHFNTVSEVFANTRFVTCLVAGSLPDNFVEGLFVETAHCSTEKEYKTALAQLLSQTEYKDLSQIAIATPEIFCRGVLLLCHQSIVLDAIKMMNTAGQRLICLDWQPLSVLRILLLVMLAVKHTPSLREYLLSWINRCELLHLQALGAAINGVMYVAN